MFKNKPVIISICITTILGLLSLYYYERYYYSTKEECILKMVSRHGINNAYAYRLASKYCTNALFIDPFTER